jgi:hypothetical protein
VNLAILSYLFKISFPPLKYPSLVLYTAVLIYVLIKYNSEIIYTIKVFLRNYLISIILLIILVLAIILSNKFYRIVVTDTLNVVVVLSSFFILTILVKGKEEFSSFIESFLNVLIVFAIGISIFGMISLLDILPDHDTLFNEHGNRNLVDTSIIDYNFSLLPVFFGLIAVLTKMNNKISLPVKSMWIIILAFFTLQIFLTGSRRGLFVLVILLAILIVLGIFSLMRKNNQYAQLGLNSIFYLISVAFLVGLLYAFTFHTTFKFKRDFFELIGTKNGYVARSKISSNLFRYLPVLRSKLSYSEFYEKIWTIKFNPKDPDLGDWGTRIHSTVYPLTGKNVEMVPHDAKGYLMDSTCNCLYAGNNFCEAYTLVTELNCKKGDKYTASVYCFVSDEFNGKTVSLGTDYYSISNGIVFGKMMSYYDLNNKSCWQKLEISFECNEGKVPIYLSFLQDSVKDFLSLEGHVIFAYPQYSKVQEDGLLKNSQSGLNPLLKHRLTNVKTGPKINTAELMGFSSLLEYVIDLNKSYESSYKRWYSHVNIEDTTYFPPKKMMKINTFSNEKSSSRIARWEFGWQIYIEEYNWLQKITGNGFNFMNWYGYYFLKDKTKSDWPHNPFLAVLLYSGIIGLLLYLLLLSRVFYYYITYIREYHVLFIFFLITFFFSFFSGSSPFDPPIMGFFVILPFFMHSIQRKKINENT